MAEFSLQECAKRLGIDATGDMECAKALYMNMDKMISKHRRYLNECVYDKIYDNIGHVDREVWEGVLFCGLKMAIESQIGGAVKQVEPGVHRDKQSGRELHVFKVMWATAGAEICCEPVILTQQEQKEEKHRIQKCIDEGETYAPDLCRRFEIYCDMLNYDAARLSPKSCYVIGTEILQYDAILDVKEADAFAMAYEMYCQMTSAQRMNDFNRLRKQVDEINQSDPFMIMISRWCQNGGDNQGNSRNRE